MIFKNALVFYRSEFRSLDVEILGDRIVNIGEELSGTDTLSLEGKLLLPGFIDVHTHGREGLDFSTASAKEIGSMCMSYAQSGVTSILATTMTMEYGLMDGIMENNRKAIEANYPGCKILGINLEGPFLGPDRKGCHDEKYLLPPSKENLEKWDTISGNNIRMIDLDPNLPNAIEFIKQYSKHKIISIAHTSASYDKACEAVKAGATHVTHLFNAMNSLHHREPGIVGMVFDSPVHAEIICDGIHIHPSVLRLVFHAMGDKLVIISDSMSAAGLGNGEYELGGLKVYVNNKKATLEDGTIAGSTTNIFDEVKNLIAFGIEKEKAVLSATLNPAKAIGADQIGEIEIGKKADLLVVSDDFNLEQVYIDGKLIIQ